ncbi:AMP-binding protein [Marinobacter sp. KMM 10035]
MQLLYTSGTTANPKGVITSHLAVTMTAMSNTIAKKTSSKPAARTSRLRK